MAVEPGVRRAEVVAAFVFGILLMAPALWNGTILLFPDSIGYFRAGEAVLKFVSGGNAEIGPSLVTQKSDIELRAVDGISTSRSIYYGLPFVLLHRFAGSWGLVIVQAALATAALYLAAPRLIGGQRPLLLAATGAFAAGLAMFTSVAMPDLFTGLLILAFAMVVSGWREMRPAEFWWWAMLIFAGALVHKANLALLAVLIGLYAIQLVWWHRQMGRLPLLAAILGVSVVAHAAVGLAVERLSGHAPSDPPFVLAQLVGDGTAEKYLATHCETQQFRLCHYQDRLPMTAANFLWSPDPATGLLRVIPMADSTAILAESWPLAQAVLAAYPGTQLLASFKNSVRQFFCVGVTEFAVGPSARTPRTPGLGDALARYGESPVARGKFPFTAFSMVMTVSYVAALAALVAALVKMPMQGGVAADGPRRAALGWLIAGLVLNAAISGVIAGVFDRYQGRIAWLMPLAALTALAILRRRRIATA